MSSWDDAAGLICPTCLKERFQFFEGQCVICVRLGQIRQEEREKKQVRDKERAQKHKLWTYRKEKKKRPLK